MLVSMFFDENNEVKTINPELGGYNYRYMDGTIKNRKFFYGFCNCHLHQGCLTSDMAREHCCVEKECEHLFVEAGPKTKKKKIKPLPIIDYLELLNKSNPIEGCRFMTARFDKRGLLVIKYTAICSIDIHDMKQYIDSVIKEKYIIQDCNYDFDTAMGFVYGS